MPSLDDTRKAIELETLRDQLNRYRTAALALYGPLKVLVGAWPDDAVGKPLWQARLNAFRHTFDIRY